MRLKDSIAIITGGGQGIGRGIALLFAEQGAKVVIAARSVDKLAGVQSEIEEAGGEVLAVPTDVGARDQMEALFAATVERFGGLDILVNNAGIGQVVGLDGVTDEDYDRMMDCNLRGMHLGCQLAVPLMKAQGKGSIINMASVHGVEGSPSNTVYATTKGGIIGGTRALAAELARTWIAAPFPPGGTGSVPVCLSWCIGAFLRPLAGRSRPSPGRRTRTAPSRGARCSPLGTP